jgi:N-acetylglucosaminyldiphosphoundecaprenol N-acetyl-beta-D-mannosaminyltransferase
VSYSRHWVLGVPVDDATEAQVLKFVAEAVESRSGQKIVTVNAEYVVKARQDPEFLHVVRDADLATADGAGVLWALRRQGIRIPRRVGGSDLIWSISHQAAQHGHRIFFLGAAPGVAGQAAGKLAARYPGLSIAGTFAGSPGEDENGHIVDLIRRSKADILFVAFGAPQQDLWISQNLTGTGAAVAMGVGGSFDYVAGIARRAPRWMQDHGLDWLWRLVRQPWRWRRMIALPIFVWLVLTERSGMEKGTTE